MKLTEEQKLGLKSLNYQPIGKYKNPLNNISDAISICIYRDDFKDNEAFDIIAENLNIKNATNIQFAVVGFKGGYKKSELNETLFKGGK
jgi:hypothetical protein